jgi:hypothetical protein
MMQSLNVGVEPQAHWMGESLQLTGAGLGLFSQCPLEVLTYELTRLGPALVGCSRPLVDRIPANNVDSCIAAALGQVADGQLVALIGQQAVIPCPLDLDDDDEAVGSGCWGGGIGIVDLGRLDGDIGPDPGTVCATRQDEDLSVDGDATAGQTQSELVGEV